MFWRPPPSPPPPPCGYISDALSCLQKVLEGLDERFGKANKVMNWLSDCAKAIARTEEPVQWTTRLGLPVVQPYKHHVRFPLLHFSRRGKEDET